MTKLCFGCGDFFPSNLDVNFNTSTTTRHPAPAQRCPTWLLSTRGLTSVMKWGVSLPSSIEFWRVRSSNWCTTYSTGSTHVPRPTWHSHPIKSASAHTYRHWKSAHPLYYRRSLTSLPGGLSRCPFPFTGVLCGISVGYLHTQCVCVYAYLAKLCVEALRKQTCVPNEFIFRDYG